MQLTPTILVHMTAAIGAVVIGPVALWARRGRLQRPALHRVFGCTWVTLMVITAVSAIFIRESQLPNISGFTPIHLLIPVTLGMIFLAFRALFVKRDIRLHSKLMQRTYIGACVIAGFFTLAPGRLIGSFLHTGMVLTILQNTPLWVWGLLAGLLALGWSQTRDRQAGIPRIAVMPLVMTAFSLSGLVSTFNHSPMFASVLMVWGVFAATVFSIVAMGTANARYDAATRTIAQPGSWTPMALIVGIFLIKYVSGVSLAMNPHLATETAFALGTAALSGAVSGMFIGRAVRLLKVAFRPMPAATPAPAQA